MCLVINGDNTVTRNFLSPTSGYLDRAVVLGGMNFTMALTATVSLDIMDKESIAASALSEAKTAVQQYEIPSDSSDDDDDDI